MLYNSVADAQRMATLTFLAGVYQLAFGLARLGARWMLAAESATAGDTGVSER